MLDIRFSRRQRSGFAAAFAVTVLSTALPGIARAEPDLFIREYDVRPPVVQAGDDLTISGDVYNGDRAAVAAGTLTAGGNGYMVDLVLSTDEFAPVDWAAYRPAFHEDVLLRGGRFSRTPDVDFYDFFSFRGTRHTVPADTPPGDYFACAVVDPGQRIAETDEGNNTVCAPVRVAEAVPELPDFAAEVAGTRTECRAGRNLHTVLVALGNLGPGTFEFPNEGRVRPTALVSVVFGGDSTVLGGLSIGQRLVPGDGNTAPFELDHGRFEKLYGRTVTIRVRVDPDEELDEANEDNNLLEAELDLPPLACG